MGNISQKHCEIFREDFVDQNDKRLSPGVVAFPRFLPRYKYLIFGRQGHDYIYFHKLDISKVLMEGKHTFPSVLDLVQKVV